MPKKLFCTFSSHPLLRSRFSNENVISERAPSAQSHSHRWSSVSLPLYACRSCFIPGCFSLRGKRYGLQSLRTFIVLGSADWACWSENVEGNREMRWRFFFLFSSFMLHQSVQAPHKRTQGHLGRHSRTDCCLKCKTVFHSQWFDISWVSMGIEKYKASHWMWLRTHVLVSYFVLIVK